LLQWLSDLYELVLAVAGLSTLRFRFDIRALPHFPRVLAARFGKGRQDPAGKAALAAVHPGLAALAPQVVFGQELLADRGADMLPGEGLVQLARR
jgi:hypothetical protein